MKSILEAYASLHPDKRADDAPEKVLQFGEGQFLRGFVDWMFHRLAEAGRFDGKIVVIQPLAEGAVNPLNYQKGLYTLITRGLQNGRRIETAELVSSIRRGINPYRNYEAFLSCADNPELRFIVSNTTEAGIVWEPEDGLHHMPPLSFPGKLAALLYRRFLTFQGASDKGVVVLPCELIDRNGDELKTIVLRLAESWRLEPEFAAWVRESCKFMNTLVDRIVAGYPKEEADDWMSGLGYSDALLNTTEPFHLWVIEGDRSVERELPFADIGLNVVWTDDLTPYRTRKVRILNGAHTMTALAALLAGMQTVKECIDDPLVSSFMREGVQTEIMPTLDLPQDELAGYVRDVFERFANPFIEHRLSAIAAGSVAKFKTRVLPSLTGYFRRTGQIAPRLAFSLAALLVFYRCVRTEDGSYCGEANGVPYILHDDARVLEWFAERWAEAAADPADGTDKLVCAALACEPLWDSDLTAISGLQEAVAAAVALMMSRGAYEAMRLACE